MFDESSTQSCYDDQLCLPVPLCFYNCAKGFINIMVKLN